MARKTLALPELEDVVSSVGRHHRVPLSRLTDEEKVAVLWGMHRHWTSGLIANKIGCGISSV